MKTSSAWLRFAVGFVATMLCASAFAGPSPSRESAAKQPQAAQPVPKKNVKIYIVSSASAIPTPISYLIGGVITTPTPIQIIGRGTTFSR